MIGFKVVNLDLLLQVKSEEQIRRILNDFESPLNPDIENFLKYKAVEFSKSAIAKNLSSHGFLSRCKQDCWIFFSIG